MDVLNVTLLDALKMVVELSYNGTRIAILRDHISLVVVVVIYFAQWGANCCGSALGSLVNLGELLDRNWTALNLHAKVLSDLLQTHIGD